MVSSKEYLEWAKFRWKWYVIENFLALPMIFVFILLHHWFWAGLFALLTFLEAVLFVRKMRRIMRLLGLEDW